ncbi:GK1 [Symbiodinium sp. CCMP2592]|nr:GK1 [Symbiodinium sp. CCMP2592]
MERLAVPTWHPLLLSGRGAAGVPQHATAPPHRACASQTRTCSKVTVSAVIGATLRTWRKRVREKNLTPSWTARLATAAAEPGVTGGLLVLCGPSGVGKSTLVKHLLGHETLGSQFGLVVSHTTREPRASETDGVEYHFVSREKMEQMIANGLFLEHAEVHGNLYGTSFAAIQDICDHGHNCILDIDIAGVRSLHRYLQDKDNQAHFVEVLPEGGLATLESRLRARGGGDEAELQTRLETARREMKEYGSFQWDSTILSVDGDVDSAVRELLRVATKLALVVAVRGLDPEPGNTGKVSSRDVESFGSSRTSRLSSDMDSGEGEGPDQEVEEIDWLQLMSTTPESQESRDEAFEMAEDFWMLQRRARFYEALENLKALPDEPARKTPAGERDIGDVKWARRSHETKEQQKTAAKELESLEPLTSILVGKDDFTDDKMTKEKCQKVAANLGQKALDKMYDDWVKRLNGLTPACFMQTVAALVVEEGQQSLNIFMESLSMDLSLFGANRRVGSLPKDARMWVGPKLSEWDRSKPWDWLGKSLGSFRIVFKQRTEMTLLSKLTKDLESTDTSQSCGRVLFSAAAGQSLSRISYSIIPAVQLLNANDSDLSLMLKVLVDAGRESQCFTTVVSKALLDEALIRTSWARAADWLVDMLYLVILLLLAIAVNSRRKPLKTVQVCFFIVSLWVALSLLCKLYGGLRLFWSRCGACRGFFAGVIKHATLWNLVMSSSEVFSTYFAFRFCIYVVYDADEGAWTLFRQHPGFLSFLVLVRWTQLGIGLLQVELLGRNVVPVVHAISRPESLSFLFFLFIIVLGSFHAYYVFPIKENTGSLTHVLNTFLKIFRLEILGDFSLSELEGLGDQLHGSFSSDHTFDGEVDEEAYDRDFHRSLRAEFVALSLAVNVVFLNVYIGLLGELYGKSVERKTQLYHHYLASYAYRNLSRALRPGQSCGDRSHLKNVEVVWVATLAEEQEEKSGS